MASEVLLGLHAGVCAVGALAAVFVLQARYASACLSSPVGRRRWIARGLLALLAIGLFAESGRAVFGDDPPGAGEFLVDLALTTALLWSGFLRRPRRVGRERTF